jgi:hypothetical protein
MIHLRLASFLAAASLSATPAFAQGMVQLTLSGEVDRTGGARAEVEVTFVNGNTNNEARTVAFGMFLAERTSAADLAVLIEKRFVSAGARAVNTSQGQPGRAVTCLFIEDVLGVSLRLGQGLRATVTLSEDRPQAVRVLPPEDAPQDAILRVTASTWFPHERVHKRAELETRLDPSLTASRMADLLANQAIRSGWPSEIERHETWLPGATAAAGLIQGASFDLITSGDWRLELVLTPRRQDR